MRIHSFFASVHQDRFADLNLIVGDAPVTMEPYGVDGDVAIMYFTGEAETTLRLDRALRSVKDILESAPVFEEVCDA